MFETFNKFLQVHEKVKENSPALVQVPNPLSQQAQNPDPKTKSKQALRNSCELLRQRKELHTSS